MAFHTRTAAVAGGLVTIAAVIAVAAAATFAPDPTSRAAAAPTPAAVPDQDSSPAITPETHKPVTPGPAPTPSPRRPHAVTTIPDGLALPHEGGRQWRRDDGLRALWWLGPCGDREGQRYQTDRLRTDMRTVDSILPGSEYAAVEQLGVYPDRRAARAAMTAFRSALRQCGSRHTLSDGAETWWDTARLRLADDGLLTVHRVVAGPVVGEDSYAFAFAAVRRGNAVYLTGTIGQGDYRGQVRENAAAMAQRMCAFDRTPCRERPARQAPADTEQRFICPQGGIEAVAELQRAVDEGHQPWRANPADVAAACTFGVPNSIVERVGQHTYRVTQRATGEEVLVEVTQPLRRKDGGIWVVTNVTPN